MGSNRVVRGLGSSLPYAGLVLVGLVAVTTAMTVLGTGAMPSVAPPSVVATPTETASYLVPTPSPPDIYPTVSLPATPPQLTAVTENLRGAGGHWKVQFRYPQFVAYSTPLAWLINLDIRSEIETRIDIYAAGPASVPDPGGATNWLIGDYTVELLTPQVACMILNWSDNSASKERPRYGFQALNFDLASGRRMVMSEIFADQPAALSIISSEARAQLRVSLGGDYVTFVVEGGTEPEAANFTGWSLTPEGLKITLDMYQVAGYRHGLPVVLIPWSKLAGVIRPDGPAGEVAALAAAPSPSATPSSAGPSPTAS
jgi:hypothetical protein